MTKAPQDPQSLRHELEGNAQVNAAARFWTIIQAQELQENPHLRPNQASDFGDDRRKIALIGLVGRRVVRLIFGVLLREVTRRPGVFSQAVASLADGMVAEIGENLQAFPIEERIRAFTGLTQVLASGMQIGLAAPDEAESEAEEPGR
ncbi:MAG: hypothetical protein JWQ97_3397 [Phenylobacterium sp.]|nr:hypothetical protein [Phenylobacterium sp.]